MKESDDGIVPEEGEEELLTESVFAVRLRALFLLLIFILPILLTVIELLTGPLKQTPDPPAAPTPTLFGLRHF